MLLLSLIAARPGAAQLQRSAGSEWLSSAGSEAEVYLRALQLVGIAPLYPWSVRGFSPQELSSLAPESPHHPWGQSFHAAAGGAQWMTFMPDAGAIYNSRFPYGANDGAIWAGRGATTSLAAGARVAYGVLDVQLAPIVFRAENATFGLAPNGLSGPLQYADERRARDIDLPQRFGTGAYERVDLGESTVRLTGLGVSGGVSTAHEYWGPAVRDPFLLGDNAPGFLHLFMGTAHPVGFAGVSVHVRAIAGKLEQSQYSITQMVGRGRYLSGLTGVVTLRQLPGLEVGGGRLFQNFFDDSLVSLRQVIGPLVNGLLKKQRQRSLGTREGREPDNQIASLFARWVFPSSGFEVYAEYGRDDSAYDLRDLVEEPDHDASYLLGFQRGWKRSNNRIVQLRAEVFNDRISHLDAVRAQSPAYVHDPITQGHTNIGQVLGAPDGFGGGGSLLSLDNYTAAGRTTAQYVRSVRAQALTAELKRGSPSADVLHSLMVERLTFGRRLDFVRSFVVSYELNRDFTHDAVNLGATAGFKAHW